MPFAHIRLAGFELHPLQAKALREETTQLVANNLQKDAELTAVLVEEHPASDWAVAGVAVAVAAHLDVKVTAGTNNSAQKAAFVREAHAMLAAFAPADLPTATYVVIDQIPADAWGYGGLTQGARRTR